MAELSVTRGVILVNGDLIFPTRGKPPKEVKGYNVDTKNPYVFHPIMPECEFRKEEVHTVPCCAGRPYSTCTKEEPPVMTNYSQCSECQGTPDLTEEVLDIAEGNYEPEESDSGDGSILIE